MGLPKLLLILLCAIIFALEHMMFSGYDLDGLLVNIIFLALIAIVRMSVTNGYVYAR